MLTNIHSYYSLRYGTLSIDQITTELRTRGYNAAALTDINNTTGSLEFIKSCLEKGLHGIVGVEFRTGDKLQYIGIAKNPAGFRELNELLTDCNLASRQVPATAPEFNNVFVIYPFETCDASALRENEFFGVQRHQLTKIRLQPASIRERCIIWNPVTFIDASGFKLHCRLRAIDNNILLSQLKKEQVADRQETFPTQSELLQVYGEFPELIRNTVTLMTRCSFDFDFTSVKNKKTFTGSAYDDRMLLEKLAKDGLKERYGTRNAEATMRVKKELAIIDALGFSSYFLITWDIIRYSMSRGFYHVGRGSGANSVVAYCLKITDVCPIELDLYFERFLNPKRKSPPDFDLDFSWKDRDEIFDYIFKRHGHKHTALLGAMSTFRDRSIIRELGKVYGLPKGEIDQLIRDPGSMMNKHEISELILSVRNQQEDLPNLRSIHAGGILISEEPITSYSALDLPPKGFPTVQFDMYLAEDIGFEKLDILSQRGIGHINECVEIVQRNRERKIDIHAISKFKNDDRVRQQLKSGDTIGCFYVESPAMRGLLKKLRCEDYTTLVAASSIIRPGVAKSGMMREYIQRFPQPGQVHIPASDHGGATQGDVRRNGVSGGRT